MKSLVSALLAIAGLCSTAMAEIQSQTRTPSQSAQVYNGDWDWQAINNVLSDDGSSASVSDPLGEGSRSSTLIAKGYGFSLPTDATVKGIVVKVKRKADAAYSVEDGRVNVLVGGFPTSGSSAQKANYGVFWPTILEVQCYGSETDTWGRIWTSAEINSAGFGGGVMCNLYNSTHARVDVIAITVYYE